MSVTWKLHLSADWCLTGCSDAVPAAAALVLAAYAPYGAQLQRYGRYQEQLLVPAIRALGESGASPLIRCRCQPRFHSLAGPDRVFSCSATMSN